MKSALEASWLIRALKGAYRGVSRVLRRVVHPFRDRNVVELTSSSYFYWRFGEEKSEIIEGLSEEKWWRLRYLTFCSRSASIETRAASSVDFAQGVGIIGALGVWLGIYIHMVVLYGRTGLVVVLLSLLLGILTIVPFVVVATHMFRRWLPYLAGFIFNYLVASVSMLAIGRSPSEVLWPIADFDTLGVFSAALMLDAVLMLVGLVFAAAVQLVLLLIWRFYVARHANFLIVVHALLIARRVELLESEGRRLVEAEVVRLLNGIEWLRKRIDEYSALGTPSHNTIAKESLRARLTITAKHVGALGARLAVPARGTRKEVAGELRRLSLVFMLGLYDYLPTSATEGKVGGAIRGGRSLRVLRWFVTTLLPLGVVIGAPALGLNLPELAVPWLTVSALMWILARTLYVLEPQYALTVNGARELFLPAPDLSQKGSV